MEKRGLGHMGKRQLTQGQLRIESDSGLTVLSNSGHGCWKEAHGSKLCVIKVIAEDGHTLGDSHGNLIGSAQRLIP